MTKVKRVSTKRRYQYRVLWCYKGRTAARVFKSDQPNNVLRVLRRVATDQPWLGTTKTQLRKIWARLCFSLEVPFADVADMTPREAALALQRTYPELDWVRVEFRQVGEWTEMLDPLRHLQAKTTPAADKRVAAMFDGIAAMSREELDRWRSVVPDGERSPYARGFMGRQSSRKQGSSPVSDKTRN